MALTLDGISHSAVPLLLGRHRLYSVKVFWGRGPPLQCGIDVKERTANGDGQAAGLLDSIMPHLYIFLEQVLVQFLVNSSPVN